MCISWNDVLQWKRTHFSNWFGDVNVLGGDFGGFWSWVSLDCFRWNAVWIHRESHGRCFQCEQHTLACTAVVGYSWLPKLLEWSMTIITVLIRKQLTLAKPPSVTNTVIHGDATACVPLYLLAAWVSRMLPEVGAKMPKCILCSGLPEVVTWPLDLRMERWIDIHFWGSACCWVVPSDAWSRNQWRPCGLAADMRWRLGVQTARADGPASWQCPVDLWAEEWAISGMENCWSSCSTIVETRSSLQWDGPKSLLFQCCCFTLIISILESIIHYLISHGVHRDVLGNRIMFPVHLEKQLPWVWHSFFWGVGLRESALCCHMAYAMIWWIWYNSMIYKDSRSSGFLPTATNSLSLPATVVCSHALSVALLLVVQLKHLIEPAAST